MWSCVVARRKNNELILKITAVLINITSGFKKQQQKAHSSSFHATFDKPWSKVNILLQKSKGLSPINMKYFD